MNLSFEENISRGVYVVAVGYAINAHTGQKDKSGCEDYILHPIRVSGSPLLVDWTDRTIAVLHDVIEDTDVSFQTLRNLFGKEVAEAVEALTHRPNEPRTEYLARVKENERALRVKYADIYDNMGRSKGGLDEETIKRLAEKYQSYLDILNEGG